MSEFFNNVIGPAIVFGIPTAAVLYIIHLLKKE